jgi:hypothetical protein
VTDLLDTTGKSFIISGFIFFVLSIPLYYSYTPLYTGAEDFATNLLFFATLGFSWTFIGLYPIILSMAIKNIEVGDLVFYRADYLSSGPGLVVEKEEDAPTGFTNEADEPIVTTQYKVAWQDQQSVGWYWEDALSHHEKVSRGEQ